MQKNYVEVSVKADVDSGEILALLQCEESLGGWEKDGVLYLFWAEEKWSDAILEDIKRVLITLGIDNIDRRLEIQTIPDKDWNATWAASLQPIRLGRCIRVRQSWHPVDPEFKGIELVIDPQRAFGTGYHSTTQLVIEWLENHIRGGERILDVGTGSGILAMAAIRLGASSALAIDNDPVALECARQYAVTNGFGLELKLQVSTFEELNSDRFDVIVANLDGKTMPLMCRNIRRLLKSGGIVCLSGIQLHDYDEVTESLTESGLQIKVQMERDEWLAVEVGF